jgi:hypothetical protein
MWKGALLAAALCGGDKESAAERKMQRMQGTD